MNTLVMVLTWLCSVMTILTSKGIDVIVLNSVAVLFMIQLDDQIVLASDYQTAGSVIGSPQPMGRVCDIMDKIGYLMLKIQKIWTVPYFCSIIIWPLIVMVPLSMLRCYNGDTFINIQTCLPQDYPPTA